MSFREEVEFPEIEDITPFKYNEKVYSDNDKEYVKYILDRINDINGDNYKKNFNKILSEARRKYKTQLGISDISQIRRKFFNNIIIDDNYNIFFVKKLMKSGSGEINVTVVTSPGKFSCPANCHYCPNEPEIEFRGYICEKDDQYIYINKTDDIEIENEGVIETRRYMIVVKKILVKDKYYEVTNNTHDKLKNLYKLKVSSECIENIDINSWYKFTKYAQPRSYDSLEPGVMRGNRFNFDIVKQIWDRMKQLDSMNHDITKIRGEIIGGTFNYYPVDYQRYVAKSFYYAANTFDFCDDKHKLDNYGKHSLKQEKENNRNNKYRIVGLTFETRPDHITSTNIKLFREYGATTIQIGVQHVEDRVLKEINRGCYLRNTYIAIRLLLNTGFKVVIHIMPSLPNVTITQDYLMFIKLLQDSGLQSDQYKIYPYSVVHFSHFKKIKNNITMYSEEGNLLEQLLIKYLMCVWPYMRYNRIVRDIPSQSIIGGNMKTHLRSSIDDIMKHNDLKTKCIRSREAMRCVIDDKNIFYSVIQYKASGGDEYFIQATSKNENILYGLCRLRLCENLEYGIFPILKHAALIRDLHVFGKNVAIGDKRQSKYEGQHMGIGKKLLLIAENIAYDNNYKKICVISGVGVVNYYEKLGYFLNEDDIGEYPMKFLRESYKKEKYNYYQIINHSDIERVLYKIKYFMGLKYYIPQERYVNLKREDNFRKIRFNPRLGNFTIYYKYEIFRLISSVIISFVSVIITLMYLYN